MEKLQDIIEKLSPLELKIIPYLHLKYEEIKDKSWLDATSVLRALKFLESKNLVKLKTEKKKIIELGINGIYYKKNHLPERKLITLLEHSNHLTIEEAKKLSRMSDNEFKVSLGILKNKSYIDLKNGKVSISTSKEVLSRKMPEESLIEILPIEEDKLNDEQKHTLNSLLKRKDIVEVEEKSIIDFEPTSLGKEIAGKKIESTLLEEVTPDLIKNWKKSDKFRRYDINSQVPKAHGGKKHFVNQAIEKGKRIWLDLGFKEMTGTLTQTSFWNFDALFQPQDHPTREMHDTFFVGKIYGKLPEKKLVSCVKLAHEKGVDRSKGWNYGWEEEEAKKTILRTHTTSLSARTLASLNLEKDLPAKFFSIGKCFRNETVDWSHGFEFYQTEGIVVAEDLNLRQLLGYLREFYKKMGFEKVRFTPSYFPYTEPSVQADVFHPEKKIWMEVGGAGIFRPEVTIPLLGKAIPVLAWGQGFDRIITDYYKIKDLREMYSNDIKDLREKKVMV